MKLKLETQQGVTILCVQEDVLTQHAPILRAGIIKLLQTGKKTLLLDITGATQLDEAVAKTITELQATAASMDAQIVVASPMESLGQAPTREAALRLLESALFGLLSTEAKLTAKLKKLEARKTDLANKLNSVRESNEVKAARKENSDLKIQVRDLELQVLELIRARGDGKFIEFATDRLAALEKTLANILAQDGIIQVK